MYVCLYRFDNLIKLAALPLVRRWCGGIGCIQFGYDILRMWVEMCECGWARACVCVLDMWLFWRIRNTNKRMIWAKTMKICKDNNFVLWMLITVDFYSRKLRKLANCCIETLEYFDQGVFYSLTFFFFNIWSQFPFNFWK